jgi:hypothetical protein
MVEQERRRVWSLENVLGATQRHVARPEAQLTRSEPDHNVINSTETYHTRAGPSAQATDRSMVHNEDDAPYEDALEIASSVPLPPSPSEQQVNGIAHEQPQRLPAVADRHRDRSSVYNPPWNIATSRDLNSELRTSSLLDGDTRAPLTNGYTLSSSLTNGDTHTPLTHGYHHPAPIINGENHTTANGQIGSSQRLRQQIGTIPNNANPSPNHPLTTTTRIQMNELVGVLIQVLRETELRPSDHREAQIQTITSEYVRGLRELRESNLRQFEELSEEVDGLTTARPTVNGNSGAVNGFHIDAGIVRNENAVNGTTVNGILPNSTTSTPENETGQPSFMRPRARRIDITNGSHGRHPTEPTPPSTNTAAQQEALGRWYDNDESPDYHPYRATGRDLPSSPTYFGVTTNGIDGVGRPTYATVAALADGPDLEETGSGNWTPLAQLSSSNRAWDPTATQVIGDDGTNLTAGRRFVNDTDLDELRAFRNATNLTNSAAHPRSIYHITPPGTPSLSTRSNSLSGTTLVNSTPSLSGSTLVNSSVDGDTPPPSTYGDQDIGIEVYRNGAYETTMAALRRRRAMSDIRARERRDAGGAGIPIDEHERRGAVAIGWIGLRERVLRPYPNSASEEEEDETLSEAEESWWGLRDGRAARRRDSVEEEMMAHLLGRGRHVEVPRINGVGEHESDGDDEAEPEAEDERGREGRTDCE